MDKALSPLEIKTALNSLPGWAFNNGYLEKTFELGDFRRAMAFMVRVAFEAELMNHHPNWSNCYDEVVVRLTTHHANDEVTRKDVELAKKIDKASQ
jgi:4a-hydroxytetrahydrobiopterin dehydratase